MPTTVLVFGTFDLFHPGHEFFLKEAKKYGDTLEVVIARDKTVEEVKGKKPMDSEMKRLSKIHSLDYVDDVILGSLGDKYQIIEGIEPDVIVLGYDQTFFTENLKEELKKRKLKARVIRLKESFRPKEFKSSKIRIRLENP
jgi:FAD synthetase